MGSGVAGALVEADAGDGAGDVGGELDADLDDRRVVLGRVLGIAVLLQSDAVTVFGAVTAMPGVTPVIEAVSVSVAVTVWLPAVFRVTPVKVCTPLSAAVKV